MAGKNNTQQQSINTNAWRTWRRGKLKAWPSTLVDKKEMLANDIRTIITDRPLQKPSEWSVKWRVRHLAIRRFCAIAAGVIALLIDVSIGHTQPIAFQVTVATNDKIRKELKPYRIAFADHFGAEFLDKHYLVEGSRICKLNDEWAECGYVELGRVAEISEDQRRRVREIMKDPCTSINDQAIKIAFKSEFARLQKSKLVEGGSDLVKSQTLRMKNCKNDFTSTKTRMRSAAKRENGLTFEAFRPSANSK